MTLNYRLTLISLEATRHCQVYMFKTHLLHIQKQRTVMVQPETRKDVHLLSILLINYVK